MAFSSFFEVFPELVDSEFRNIFILEGTYQYIPAGRYAFLELFCQDLNCDCRNVIINIVTISPFKIWAVLRYGWESKNFYKEWFGGNCELSDNFPGVFIDPFMGSDLPTSNQFLVLFSKIIQDDKKYAQRIETHYQMFKEKIQDKSMNRTIRRTIEKSGRNDPCPCNSGKKFKRCCLIKG